MFAADNPFLPQARLAARVLRSVAKEPDLALKGGTAINLLVEALQGARARLVRELRQSLLPRHVQFLRSVKGLDPEWALLAHAHVAELPAVRWRLQNLEKFRKEQPERYAAVRDRLEEVLKEFHGQ